MSERVGLNKYHAARADDPPRYLAVYPQPRWTDMILTGKKGIKEMDNKSKFLHRKWTAILIVILSNALLVGVAYAQGPLSREKILELGLPTISGEVTVYYSEGYAERATYLQGIAEAANHFLRRPEIVGVDLDLGLAVLDSEDWAKLTRIPYGISHIHNLGVSPTAIVPASEDNVLVKGYLENKERVSKENLRRLEKLDLSFEDAASMFVDLVGIHEIGHIYAHDYGTWPTEKWLNEFIATYLAYAFMKDLRPKMVWLWETMNDVAVEANENEHTTLRDFEVLYMGVGGGNYGWYQGRFQQKASEVFAKLGISFIHYLKQSLADKPKASDNDPFRLQQLDVFSGGFVNWAKGPRGELN